MHVRLDTEKKAQGEAVLATIGLSVADAVHLLCHRIVTDQAFPLELTVKNVVTRAAMVEADAILDECRAVR